MVPTSSPKSEGFTKTLVVEPAMVRYCHIKLEDAEKPVAAIEYKGHYYSLFRALPDWTTTEKIVGRLSTSYVITAIKRGWVIWAFEY
jgi:hypothetical protein